jgi:hypothetical protein
MARPGALEGTAPVGPSGQVQQCAEGTVNQSRRRIEREVAHVGLAQVEHDACPARAGTGLGEHRRRCIDTDHQLAGRLRDWDGNPPVPDRKLDQRPVRLAGEAGVEPNIGRHVGRPFLIPVRERLVPAHRPILPATSPHVDLVTGPVPRRPKARLGWHRRHRPASAPLPNTSAATRGDGGPGRTTPEPPFWFVS